MAVELLPSSIICGDSARENKYSLMKTEQRKWIPGIGWTPSSNESAIDAQLVLIFGAADLLKESEPLESIRKMYPAAQLLGCSTAGEISGTQVSDDSIVATAVRFESTQICGAEVVLRDRDAILSENIVDNQRALDLAQIQFKVGKIDLRVVGQRQLALYGARTSRLHVQSEQLAQRVNLYLALGGSF